MSVLVSYLHPNKVSHNFMDSLLNVMAYETQHGNNLKGRLPVHPSIINLDGARNVQAEAFLNETDYDWLWLVDSDVGFKPDTLSKLLEVADPDTHPIVSAVNYSLQDAGSDGCGGSVIKQVPCFFVNDEFGAFKRGTLEDLGTDRLAEVSGVGAGCLIIHRSALIKVYEKYGCWFTYMMTADSDRLGEDLSFCYRASQVGIPIFVDTAIHTTHHKEIWLGEHYGLD